MSMIFDGEFETHRAPDELWTYFVDPDIVADCAPGMEEMNRISDSEYEATITVGVGSVKPTFSVDATVLEMEEPEMLVMKAEGSGGRKGAFEAVSRMEMSESEDGGTILQWEAEANVSGIIASLGQRALGSVAERLIGQFFDCMEGKVEQGVDATPRMAPKSDAEADLD
ncbi:CoxG family protein [Natrarchaeobius oligotrophus]|nr:carbon monoxide dehydrogenase subunit G [Natrarchaeobius chitinivorans]